MLARFASAAISACALRHAFADPVSTASITVGGLGAFLDEALGGDYQDGATAPLTERGYLSLAISCRQQLASLDAGLGSSMNEMEERDAQAVQKACDDQMLLFIRRVVEEKLECAVLDDGSLGGFAPWYSGSKAVQSLAHMEAELQAADWLLCGAEVSIPGMVQMAQVRGHLRHGLQVAQAGADATAGVLDPHMPPLVVSACLAGVFAVFYLLWKRRQQREAYAGAVAASHLDACISGDNALATDVRACNNYIELGGGTGCL
eukprot:TRINITY_DN75899_c0_g1_i1.p1 TRINITY_DN75899_c0_g1~~TRINITY_DN75899_c0_g1_i1.p1  ORF type:complete len:262 (+),score=37.37 TRINITY_DN75899_c0_g1_i1:90-875(+)